jgi:hypothetical protein
MEDSIKECVEGMGELEKNGFTGKGLEGVLGCKLLIWFLGVEKNLSRVLCLETELFVK